MMVAQPANLEAYFEAAKTEELARQLESQGYKITRRPARSDAYNYDLIATKNGHKIAFDVILRSNLQQRIGSIADLRERAHQQGYNEFRLVVIDPPRQTVVEIEGIEGLLLAHLREDVPQELLDLSSYVRVEDVNYVETNSVEINADGIHVVGSAVVDVDLQYGGGQERDGLDYTIDVPFRFDILLSHDLEIKEVNELVVDTSSFDYEREDEND